MPWIQSWTQYCGSPGTGCNEVIDFEYHVEWVARKTLGIAVLPDGSVHVRAPLGTEHGQIERRLLARSDWIRRQMDYFQDFDPRSTSRSYVAGESHLFLGKSYRLKLSCEKQPVAIRDGWFMISISNPTPGTIKSILQRWYREEARRVFPPLLEHEWKRVASPGNTMPKLVIKTMTRRWGSLSGSRVLTLNIDLIRAPKSCIEYVICHELCHLEHADHSAAFFAHLSRVMSDWEKRKTRLELLLK